MSSKLWEFFLRDDVESFRWYLAGASYTSGGQRAGSGGVASNFKSGNPVTVIPSSLGVSPKAKKLTGTSPAAPLPDRSSGPRWGKSLSRDELNARDQLGRTLLHHIASSSKATAVDFALALLEAPYLDIYAQDWESGWTALHRALYAGNATIAQALMARDIRDATDLSKPGASGHPSGGLIKIKDREGYSPFDVYAATINCRDFKRIISATTDNTPRADFELNDASSATSSDDEETGASLEKPRVNLFGDEVYTFGSNKNLNLGVGDQDDRQFPERITLKRPEHLLLRLYREYENPKSASPYNLSFEQDLPAFIKAKPIKIHTIAMSKLHTAILTNDPESNLFMCGFGPGGRLGTGDETTRFSFVSILGGGLSNKKIVSIALGQDHTLAVTENGDIFSWGTNKFGQLGYSLPRTNNKDDLPIQTSPRQIFNPFKKEFIYGAAASAIHSVVFSSSGLYTFGKNEGQLGLVDSDARSLEVQTTPRRVGASLFNTQIQSVSATDQATAVLLQNHEVWVFSHYGYSRLSFPLETNSRFLRDSFMTTRYDTSINRIVKIRSGGNTICALSSSGEVYTAQVNKLEHLPSLTSTTNPSKIRNSLSTPVRVWSVKKAHMAVKDVDVGQDGSIIICTASGSAWRKEKRRKTKAESSKDYKFARVPGLSRAVGVCSNAFGAFAVVQRECDVTKEQIHVNPTSLWEDIFLLSPFNSLRTTMGSMDSIPIEEELWDLKPVTAIKQAIMSFSSLDFYFRPLSTEPLAGAVWVMTTTSDIRFPVHEFIMAGRSSVLRQALHDFRRENYSSVPELLTIEEDDSGQCRILFQGVDILAVLNFAFFLYTDNLLDVWQHARHTPQSVPRYRQVRTEVIRIAANLNLSALERAAILMIRPSKTMKADFALALNDPTFLESGDVVIELNGDQIVAHSQVICQRCPFFNVLFYGRSGGRWLSSRLKSPQDKIHVDLKHIDKPVFEFVLRYMYADTDDRLFDEVRTKDTEDFINLIIDVAYVANELMIDKLAQTCQKVLGEFVTSRNVCHLLNSLAPCFVTEFKDASLEYICLNLEDLISNKILGDLEDYLLRELDSVCHDNQVTTFPISRARNSDDYIFEKYPELVSLVETDRRRYIDLMRLKSHVSKIESYGGKLRSSNEKTELSPSVSRLKVGMDKDSSALVSDSPVLKSKKSTGDLMFQMDDDHLLSPVDSGKGKAAIRGTKAVDENDVRPWNDTSGLGSSLQDAGSFGNRSYLDDQMASSQHAILAKSPSGFPTTSSRGKTNGSVSPPHSSPMPWSSSVISSSKKNLKDIMSEASESRVSNISMEMSARRENSSTFTQKLSQKERRKIHQQHIQEMVTAQQKAKEAPQNPWKIPTPGQAPTPPVGTSPNANGQGDLISTTPKPLQRPGMTLRQTVSGAPSPKLESPSKPAQAKGRSVSASAQPSPQPPLPGPSTAAPSTSPNASASVVPNVQSIRHIPRPEPYRKNFHSDSPGSISLATILMQQQTEKDEIREAATAKHNLEDIQAEQAFQEWWDKESRRVQGLPEPGSEPATAQEEQVGRGGRGGRGNKSSGQSKRRGKGPPGVPAGASPAQQPSRNDSETPSAQKSNPLTSRQQKHYPSPLHQSTLKNPRADSATSSPRRGGQNGHRGKQRED